MLYDLVRKEKRKHGHCQESTSKERAALYHHFAEDIMPHRVLRKDACVKCIEAEPCLAKQDWESAGQKNVVMFCDHIYLSYGKLTCPICCGAPNSSYNFLFTF